MRFFFCNRGEYGNCITCVKDCEKRRYIMLLYLYRDLLLYHFYLNTCNRKPRLSLLRYWYKYKKRERAYRTTLFFGDWRSEQNKVLMIWEPTAEGVFALYWSSTSVRRTTFIFGNGVFSTIYFVWFYSTRRDVHKS